MATVEQAIGRLRAERARIVEMRCKVVQELNSTKDKGRRRELTPLLDKDDQHLQIIDYVLNILQSEEEVVCPD